jgi:hypothetical protein
VSHLEARHLIDLPSAKPRALFEPGSHANSVLALRYVCQPNHGLQNFGRDFFRRPALKCLQAGKKRRCVRLRRIHPRPSLPRNALVEQTLRIEFA